MPIVVDASVLVDLYLGSDAAAAVAGRVRGEILTAPATVDAEVLHALRRHSLAGLVDADRIERAGRRLMATPIARHPIDPLVPRMWALRRNVTAYDAAYVALAENVGAPLLTRDARLARSSGHGARVEYIA